MSWSSKSNFNAIEPYGFSEVSPPDAARFTNAGGGVCQVVRLWVEHEPRFVVLGVAVRHDHLALFAEKYFKILGNILGPYPNISISI